MGLTSVLASEECDAKPYQLPLRARKPDSPTPPGNLVITLTVRRDIDSF